MFSQALNWINDFLGQCNIDHENVYIVRTKYEKHKYAYIFFLYKIYQKYAYIF